jgi:hypothetical protein
MRKSKVCRNIHYSKRRGKYWVCMYCKRKQDDFVNSFNSIINNNQYHIVNNSTIISDPSDEQ